jgi:PilZ domain
MAPAPANSRRWPRHQVKLPVRIITADEASEITVPGLTTEISQGGMALYGGVPLQPGDLMEVEFQTSNRLRVAASVRDRNGYCFGLEFLGLLPNENAGPGGTAEVESLGAGGQPADSPIGVIKNEDQILALFLKRHEAYLRQKEMDIKRWRYEIEEIRQSRKEIEMLVLREVLGHSR